MKCDFEEYVQSVPKKDSLLCKNNRTYALGQLSRRLELFPGDKRADFDRKEQLIKFNF